MLLIGRVEGKVDTLVHLTSATAQRIDAIETRLTQTEQKVASLAASGASSKTWVANLISVAAALAAAVALFVKG